MQNLIYETAVYLGIYIYRYSYKAHTREILLKLIYNILIAQTFEVR